MTSTLQRPIRPASALAFLWPRCAALIAMAALAAVPALARAHPPCCVQCVNPAGKNIPQAGSLPTCTPFPPTNAPKAGQNPDGFFLVGSLPPPNEPQVCGTGTADVTLIDLGTGMTFPGGNGPGNTFVNGTLIKYTQAPGTKFPDTDKMAGVVEFHLKGAGDLEVCTADSGCVTCLVPPPPK